MTEAEIDKRVAETLRTATLPLLLRASADALRAAAATAREYAKEMRGGTTPALNGPAALDALAELLDVTAAGTDP